MTAATLRGDAAIAAGGAPPRRGGTGSAHPPVDGADLAAALAVDLDSAFEPLVLAYQDRLYAFAFRITGRREDAEEVTQDAFVRAYRALRKYEPDRVRALAVRPWLYRIALNVARNRARGKSLSLVPLDGLAAEQADRDEERPDARASRADEVAELGALVAAMPARFRAAVVLRHVEELGYGEIAGILGQPEGTVKANVHRGMRWLRDALAASHGTVEVS